MSGIWLTVAVFKNPVVDIGFAETLRKKFPDVPVYSLPVKKPSFPQPGLLTRRAGKAGAKAI